MDFGLGKGARHAAHAAPFIRPDADRREHRRIAHNACVTDLFVAGVQDQVTDLAQGPGAPGLQFLVQKLGRPADLGARQALDAEFLHHRLGGPGRDPLDIHLGHRQHHRA